MALSSAPILAILIAAPESFELTWAGFGKLGRGGLLFVIFFLIWEWLENRGNLRLKHSAPRFIGASTASLLAITYFMAVNLVPEIRGRVFSWGRSFGVHEDVLNSWLMALDYSVSAVYLACVISFIAGVKAIIRLVIPFLYSVGMIAVYYLDAFFPYGTLGPLQFWVNGIVFIVSGLSKALGIPLRGYSNVLIVQGKYSTFRILIFWPSAGVHSMLIYSLVAAALILKLNAPLTRKVIYVAFGALGTYIINGVRILLIGYYAYNFARTGADLDAFHNIIGEILFLGWIFLFLLVVLRLDRLISGFKQLGSGWGSRTSLNQLTRQETKGWKA